MKFRKLRIAWSVGWGIFCVLLCVLWVRSYWWEDFVYRPVESTALPNHYISKSGILVVGRTIFSPLPENGWQLRSSRIDRTVPRKIKTFHFGNPSPGNMRLIFPHGVLAAVLVALAMAPWLSLRFSLRTLLIATTLVALLLGLIVWLR